MQFFHFKHQSAVNLTRTFILPLPKSTILSLRDVCQLLRGPHVRGTFA